MPTYRTPIGYSPFKCIGLITMEPFDNEHMVLIRPLPEDPDELKRNLQRWFKAAQRPLIAWTWRQLGSLCEADRWDAFSSASGQLYLRIIKMKFEDPPKSSDRARFRTTWFRLLIDWIRRGRRQIGKELVPVTKTGGLVVHDLADPEQVAADDALSAISVIQEQVPGPWRKWPTTTTRILVLACREVPEEVYRDDIEAAVTQSHPERGEGLSRPAQETWGLFCRWREQAESIGDRRQVTRELAFAFRGPPGELDISRWTLKEQKRGENWLSQQRRRAIQDLRARLDPRTGGWHT